MVDRLLDKLAGDQADGKSSVATYTRRANRNFMQTIHGFEDKAARVSTLKQIAEVERELMS